MLNAGQQNLEAALSLRLGSGIKRVEQLLMAAKARALREFDLTVPQYATLIALHYVPGQTAAQLARTALVSPQTMATILSNLEAKALIKRTHSTTHAKVLVCELTPFGNSHVADADVQVRSIEEELSAEFSPDEFIQFQQFLERAEASIRRQPRP